jgi:DNA repair protein RadC
MEAAHQVLIATARDAADLFEPYFRGCVAEKLLVAHLDRGNRLLRLSEHDGGAGEIDLPMRIVLADALAVGSVGLVLGHCHPSGDPAPSAADLAATAALARLTGGIGITLRDHLIFGSGRWRSFRALGLL